MRCSKTLAHPAPKAGPRIAGAFRFDLKPGPLIGSAVWGIAGVILAVPILAGANP
jgi:hypothetical protein